MKSRSSAVMFITTLFLLPAISSANDYSDTIANFKMAGESAGFFGDSYAYMVFPNVGEDGLGNGRAYQLGKYVGDVKINQVSTGQQAGSQAFSQIVFFKDRNAFENFTRNGVEFDANVQAVAISSGGASGDKNDAAAAGQYQKGLAVFTVAKGGSMYQGAVAGQKFKYKRN